MTDGMPEGVPLGYRINNAMNIKAVSAFTWKGQNGNVEGLCSFDRLSSSLRAAAILLRHYGPMHGCKTVTEYIATWAPPSENDTASYIADVCARTKWMSDYVPQASADFPTLMYAMSWHELGRPYITIGECAAAWASTYLM